jgi:hypothetical protein
MIKAREAGGSRIIGADVIAMANTYFARAIKILVIHPGLTPHALR